MIEQKTAVVTEAYSDIGYEFSRALIAKGYKLVMINRSKVKADKTAQNLIREYPSASIDSFDSFIADLSIHQEIRNVAAAISSKYKAIDALFNNAGVLLGSKQLSHQGNELHFEVNTVAPFLLTQLLKPLLSKGNNSIVVTSGSGIRKMLKILGLNSLENPAIFKKMTGSYAQSKLAISTAFAGLASGYNKANIRLIVVDLAPVKTSMSLSDGMPAWIKFLRPLFSRPQKAAQKLINTAFDEAKFSATATSGRNALPDINVQNQLINLLNKITQQSVPTAVKPA